MYVVNLVVIKIRLQKILNKLNTNVLIIVENQSHKNILMLIQILRNVLIVVLMQDIKFNKDLNVLNNAQEIMQNHQIVMFVVKNVIIISIQKQEINVLKIVYKIMSLFNILLKQDINVYKHVMYIIMKMKTNNKFVLKHVKV